ncbi:MAG: hypothetical protein M0Z76_09360 [Gammaproteobacteria bacterium]|nr:hypothetical protein [Gammaproteobacteria bacterium]
MQILFFVSHPESGPILAGLLRACQRQGVDWGCFLTGSGVTVLQNPELATLICASPAPIAVCEHSWDRFGNGPCPLPLGSQTDSSALAAQALRIISL